MFSYPLQSNTLSCNKPAGEFQVNTDAFNDRTPTVAALKDGGFVVVWHDDSAYNIHGQRYNSTGGTIGGEFQVNTDVLGDYNPTITALNDGGFVVAWRDNSGSYKIHGQIYNSTGTMVGTEFQVNTDTLSDYNPTIAALNGGGFVVVWQGGATIQGQRYNSTGGMVGTEFQVNTDAGGDVSPYVSALSTGGFVVVWNDNSSRSNIHGKMYSSTGTAAGIEFQVNTDTAGDLQPTVAALNDGGFVVVWYDNVFPYKIHGQRYDNAGTVVGGEFQVNTDAFIASNPTITALNDGGFVVMWGDDNIRGQMYDSTGMKSGVEFQVNTDTGGDIDPSVASLSDGGFVVVWWDISAWNIHGQRYNSAGVVVSIPAAAPSTLSLCDMPQQCFNSSSQGVYNKSTQAVYSISTETVVNKAGTNNCAASLNNSQAEVSSSTCSAWPVASIATTAILSVSTIVGWGLYIIKCASSATKVTPSHQTIEMNEVNDFSRSAKDNSNLHAHHVAATTLQVFIPLLIMNLQMELTKAAQTIEDQATWLTSGEKTAVDNVAENISGLSYPYQEMCFKTKALIFCWLMILALFPMSLDRMELETGGRYTH